VLLRTVTIQYIVSTAVNLRGVDSMARSGFTTIITLFTTDKSEVEIYSSFKATYPDTNMFNYHFNITCTSFLYINKRPSCIGQ